MTFNIWRKFLDPKFHCEQVGILHHFKQIVDNPSFKETFFSNYDEEFWKDVEHAISDMNACCIHLLAFFKAKWKLAEQRFKGEEAVGPLVDPEFHQRYNDLMSLLEMPDEVKLAANQLCTDNFSPQKGALIRSYFHEKGKSALGLTDFELLE